jgi:uncharacterized damage-inducible protein DinB
MVKSSIIKYWNNMRRLTLRSLDTFPDDKFEFRPVDGVRNVAELFDHMLEVELYIRKGLLHGDWIRLPYLGPVSSEKQVMRQHLVREHERTSEMLHELPEGRFMKLYETPFGRISGEGQIYVAIDEEIHHRGNLYTYLRILGIEPPQMVQNYYELFLEDSNG